MASWDADVLIIGSGIAGLMAAHLLADKKNVILITKSNVNRSNSSWAQGGIAAALGTDDDWRKHFADTLLAGLSHHVDEHVEILVKRAPSLIREMEKIGVPFDKSKDGTLSLGMEGAHSRRRIVHANGDQTGKAFTETLIHVLKDRVTFLEETTAIQLLKQEDKVVGVLTDKGVFQAPKTILATGGAGQLYERTSNVPEATGDGFALAYRAGATLADMEFVQFHPTILYREGYAHGLISEAVRGEGAVLVDEEGTPIMANQPLKDLAPRDIVSREIHRKYCEGKRVFLDCRSIPNFSKRFPGISRICEKASIDLKQLLLPVAPGAHFVSGGVWTNQRGQTTVDNLYAIGEVACTGVHGANRLASNSLLEGLVFAEAVAKDILHSKPTIDYMKFDKKVANHIKEHMLPSKKELQEKMTLLVGIERNAQTLKEMKQWLLPYIPIVKLSPSEKVSKEKVEVQNMLLVAWLMTCAALTRTESRGGHFRSDYPVLDDKKWLKTYIKSSLEQDSFIEVHSRADIKKEKRYESVIN
ncbi:L-aspartate oxidase [Halalkalibacter urbisdiaboli]|uniref:L-aspartate oxidase n=1 Tax=Halalkalibacter urbisdiaboli TaxID=1960589 RepID=UPI0013FD302A|nr:L-aspartate oxidase [Halalkalibacter urbisdiaboli]